MKTKAILTCLFIVTWSVSTFAGPAATIYVSPQGDDAHTGKTIQQPLRTVQKAVEQARSLTDCPVVIDLLDGEHRLTEPLVFDFADTRTANSPLTLKGRDGALLTGGRRITGWKKSDTAIWTVEIPEVKNGQWYFTQLFVNGQRRRQARIPNKGFHRVAGFPDGGKEVHYHTDCQRFEYAPGDIDPNWTNIDDVEVIVYHFWTDSHLPIESVDTEKRIVTFKHKAGKVFTDDFTSGGARYIVNNVYEGLDQPGEWYLNRQTGVLSYIPFDDENMETVDVIAPVAEALIRIEADAGKRQFVEHLRFENLAMAYTNWSLPPGNSNDGQGSSSVPAAIALKDARHITFDHCTIRDLGTFAFEIGNGCRENTITHCTLRNLGGGAIRINGGNENSPPLLRTGNTLIADNRIGPYGDIYPSAVGILLMHTNGNRVSHNDIHHGWYTGISVGWHWGYQRSVARDNLIEYNHIHHIGQGLLSDMGAIYTLGVSPGTVIRNNLIHDIDANHYGGWGIYNDEGSSHILIENNVVHHTKFAGYNIHYAKEITVRNNIFAFGRLQQLSRGRIEPHTSCFFENNIVYFTEGKLLDNNWTDRAYTFYYNPNQPEGRQTQSTFEMDWNLYYNPNLSLEQVNFNGQSFKEWQQRGKDRHSLYADPLFVNVSKLDFRLKDNSPAFKLGFEPIDMSTIGPRE